MTQEAKAGRIALYFLDECGCAPTLPTGYPWAREGTRPLVRYEAPEGRRVNVLGARAPYGPVPRLVYESRTGKIDASAVLTFVWRKVAQLPTPPAELPEGYRRAKPCVVVLDNSAPHKGPAVRDATPALAAAGVSFFFLPPYSPELNAIEPLWRQVKYEDLPERSHATAAALQAAIDQALDRHVAHLSTNSLCEAA